jgi:hypothetical protein
MSRHSLRVDAISQERLRPGAIIGTALTWTSRKTDALDPAFDPNNKEHVRNVLRHSSVTRRGLISEKPKMVGLVCM